jgi:hypothetical protein
MNKATRKPTQRDDDLRSEYDFRAGVRGKHHKAYGEGHTVKIHKTNGTTVVQHVTLEEGAVLLDPDVSEYFPTSEAVNAALRSLIALVPKKRKGARRR